LPFRKRRAGIIPQLFVVFNILFYQSIRPFSRRGSISGILFLAIALRGLQGNRKKAKLGQRIFSSLEKRTDTDPDERDVSEI
jgi:hypothetical protein